MKRLLISLAALLGVSGLPSSHAADPPVAKISVFANGTVQLNGQPTTLEQLKGELARLSAAKGEVWYWREAPAGEAPPITIRVLDLIGEAKVPISFSTKPDFSDYLDLKTHQSRPRPKR